MTTPPPLPPVNPPLPTISYEVNRGDIFFNWMTVMVRNRMLQIFVPVSMVFCTGLRLLPQVGRQSWLRLGFDAIIDCIGFVVVLVVIQAILGLASAFLMQHRGVLGRHTLQITEAGLIERTDVNETLHRWPGICRVFSFGGYLFIYVGENSSHQVPKRDLAPELITAFEAEVRTRANQKKG